VDRSIHTVEHELISPILNCIAALKQITDNVPEYFAKTYKNQNNIMYVVLAMWLRKYAKVQEQMEMKKNKKFQLQLDPSSVNIPGEEKIESPINALRIGLIQMTGTLQEYSRKSLQKRKEITEEEDSIEKSIAPEIKKKRERRRENSSDSDNEDKKEKKTPRLMENRKALKYDLIDP
jgi:hypothetical protein